MSALIGGLVASSCSFTLESDDTYVRGSASDGGPESGGDGAVVGGGTGGSGSTAGTAATGATGGSSTGAVGGGAGATGGASGGSGTGGLGAGGASGSAGTGGVATAPPTPGLELWLDASDLSAGPVATWNDKSGKSKHAVQASPAKQPVYSPTGLNGRPAVGFDGVDDSFSLPTGFDDFAAGVSILIVVEASEISPNEGHVFLGNTANADLIRLSRTYQTESVAFHVHDDNGISSGKGTYKVAIPSMLSGVQEAGAGLVSTRLYIDGVVQASKLLPPVASVPRTLNWVGRNDANTSYFAGVISEILVYNRALPAAELSQAHDYLRGKYGCCGN
ncbi:MAG: hypothetical protein KDB14_33565 [Planctomycetales bacterium]|nr:hypothetical protein [Planctomycetales bacterium]